MKRHVAKAAAEFFKKKKNTLWIQMPGSQPPAGFPLLHAGLWTTLLLVDKLIVLFYCRYFNQLVFFSPHLIVIVLRDSCNWWVPQATAKLLKGKIKALPHVCCVCSCCVGWGSFKSLPEFVVLCYKLWHKHTWQVNSDIESFLNEEGKIATSNVYGLFVGHHCHHHQCT